MPLHTEPFDVASLLDSRETILYFLQDAFAEGDPADIAHSIRIVVRARGGTEEVARQTGLAPETLAAELARDTGPDIATLLKILQSVDLRLDAVLKQDQAVAA